MSRVSLIWTPDSQLVWDAWLKERLSLKLRRPTKRKRIWLGKTLKKFRACLLTSYCYFTKTGRRISDSELSRLLKRYKLPRGYKPEAVKTAAFLADTYKEHFPLPSFWLRMFVPPSCVLEDNFLGLPAEKGSHIWFPLEAPQQILARLRPIESTLGDESRFREAYPLRVYKYGRDWYILFLVQTRVVCHWPADALTVIGVDRGLRRLITAVFPDGVLAVDGSRCLTEVRKKLAASNKDTSTRPPRKTRSKVRHFRTDVNHKISRALVERAARFPFPVLVLENLEGLYKSTMAYWPHQQLARFIVNKAVRAGVCVIFIDAHGTSTICPRCGHWSAQNRRDPATFVCLACGYKADADVVASLNIRNKAIRVMGLGLPGLALERCGLKTVNSLWEVGV